MPRAKSKKKKTTGRKAAPKRQAAKAKLANKNEELELDLTCLEDEPEAEGPATLEKIRSKGKVFAQKKVKFKDLTKEEMANATPISTHKGRPAVLFPGVLPGPLEPNAEVLTNGVVDLRALRSGLHLIILQAQAAIGAIEVLEYSQRKIQEQVKEKE